MTHIQDLKDRCEPLTIEMENLQAGLLPHDAELESLETIDQSNCTGTIRMKEIQELNERRARLTIEMESVRIEMLPFEAALESPEVIEQGR